MNFVIAGAPHHVILRGNNRRRLFSYPSDYKRFLWNLGHALHPGQCLLHALTLMKNHVHLILTPVDAPALAKVVQRVSQRYAQRRNADRETTGKLFEQRYFRKPILNEQQLAITTAYVELNPVRAGVVESPLDWPWSTYALHAGHDSRIASSLWTPSTWYLELGRDESERERAYTAWVEDCRQRRREPERVEKIAIIEALSAQKYTRRLRRPDESRAM